MPKISRSLRDNSQASAGFKRTFKRALAIKNVIVIRVVSKQRGEANLEFDLIDLVGPKLVTCGGTFTAHANPSLASDSPIDTETQRNRGTGQKKKVWEKTEVSNLYEQALYGDALAVLAQRLRIDLGISAPHR